LAAAMTTPAPRVKILDLPRARPGGTPHLERRKTRPNEAADVTLLNLNLMLVNDDGTFDQQVYIPLGLLYIAAFLEKHGYNVEFADYQLFNEARSFNVDLLVDCLGDPAPIIGISCMSNLLPFCIQVSRALKSRYPQSKIVLGGVGPSPVAKEIVDAFPFIDSVVEGEGELNMLRIVQGDIERLPRKRVPVALDALPMPAYRLIQWKDYDAQPSVITSRGCPYTCTFCTEPYNFNHSVRFRSVESVLDEIELIHEQSGRTMFLFQDDILPLKPSRFRELLKGFRNLSFPIEWKCFSRVDLMTEQLMEDMVASGCVQIRYGIESGSNKTLKTIEKRFDIELAYDVAVRSLKYFPTVHASFIWGYPFEDETEFRETLDQVTRFEDAGISVLLFEYAPLPGSPLYKSHRDNLIFNKDRYSFYVVTGHEIVKHGTYEVGESHNPVYDIIVEHPRIFSGFYQYDSPNLIAMRKQFAKYDQTRRTRVKNEYDL
jgi:radical SAM superfamily enzyme YgiQ (UPF0313 family)